MRPLSRQSFPTWHVLPLRHHLPKWQAPIRQQLPTWQLPFRFMAMDVPYVGFYVRNLRRRPRAEVIETAALLSISTIGNCDA